jgi:glutamate-1-semialdehyde 2,1-aminomutase
MTTIKQDILEQFESRTPSSRVHDQKARRSLPGGDTRWATYYKPYPAYMVYGKGYTLRDCDGNEYIDFVNNYTSLIHGHRPDFVLDAVKQAMEEDFIYAAPSEAQYLLADEIATRVPGIDQLRYTNSGSEATLMAMRTARAYTGKQLILKLDGTYHGSHDFVEVSITPDMSDSKIPAKRVEGRGIPDCVLEGIVIARFNDAESVRAVLEANRGNVAGILVEPVMNQGGIIPADISFLRALRTLADEFGALLIFDEIVTFRLSFGGLQEKYGILPDITALGKSIGGGFPIGAFGARKEIMDLFDFHNPSCLHHSGTFNGHNFTMRAGLAALKAYSQAEIDRVNTLGERLKRGIDGAFTDAGIRGHATNCGSLLYTHWTDQPIKESKDVFIWKAHAADLPRLLHLALLNRGVFAANRGLMNISTPMTGETIDRVIEIFSETLVYLKPYVEQEAPALIR